MNKATGEKRVYCGNCKAEAFTVNNHYMLTNFCPNCGLEMENGEELDDEYLVDETNLVDMDQCDTQVEYYKD